MREENAMSSLRCPRLLLVALLIPALAGCFYSRRARDVESDPTVDTGMGASIILPGQTAPPMSMGTPVPAGAEASGAGNTVQRPNLSMIGGSEIDKERHETGKEDPLIFKALMTPLAVLAAPFVAAADAMKGDPEPSPAVPDQKTPRPDVKRRDAARRPGLRDRTPAGLRDAADPANGARAGAQAGRGHSARDDPCAGSRYRSEQRLRRVHRQRAGVLAAHPGTTPHDRSADPHPRGVHARGGCACGP
jgi:hypothetical protein